MNGLHIYDWSTLDAPARRACLLRPRRSGADVTEKTRGIVEDVRLRGDTAVADYTRQFDGVDLSSTTVTEAEFAEAEAAITPRASAALDRSIGNVRRFHAALRASDVSIETAPGVRCERLSVPIRAVGLYVPAGTAPLPSTAIMLAVPATLAGCPICILCTPPRPDGRADPSVLVAARRCGITRVVKAGGAQAIAAMAYGTKLIPKVDKLFGPGNAWVTAAKLLVAQDSTGAAIDLPAGPSEVMIIADDGAHADFVASDLLAQAEHDPWAQTLLVTTSKRISALVRAALATQIVSLTRRELAGAALGHGRIIVVEDISTALDICNTYAPEHLILAVRDPRSLLGAIHTAGSVFLGDWAPEAIGDYCSGANHVLPTYGHARACSGLSVADFERRFTVQEVTPTGLRDLGPVAIALAELEGLDGHARSIAVRLAALDLP